MSGHFHLPDALIHLQGIRLITNAVPVDEHGAAIDRVGHITISVVTVDGSTQSNAIDCGCHASIALRSMAAGALAGSTWAGLDLPSEADGLRDAQWRQRIAWECLTGRVELKNDGV